MFYIFSAVSYLPGAGGGNARGEDPEKIEEEMGDLLDDDDPFSLEGTGRKRGQKTPPRVDETLYDL